MARSGALARFVNCRTRMSRIAAATTTYGGGVSPYRRREPERSLLHATVRDHLKTFLAEVAQHSDSGAGLPRFVVAEFERYLACGILSNGFARVRCTSCGDELLVAFSCKVRGFCPSCTTRRMQSTATNLVDRVLPHAPMRQWVLSLPRWARFLLARDAGLITRTLDFALREIFSSQRRRARRAGARAPQAGAVTFVQRFGGALNLNVHFHCVIPDGVFVREEGAVRLRRVRAALGRRRQGDPAPNRFATAPPPAPARRDSERRRPSARPFGPRASRVGEPASRKNR